MATEQEKSRFDKDDILARNVNIDTVTVASHDRLVQELERLGVEVKKPQFKLEHPLGGDRPRFSNRARR